jgi:hypothetical protein
MHRRQVWTLTSTALFWLVAGCPTAANGGGADATTPDANRALAGRAGAQAGTAAQAAYPNLDAGVHPSDASQSQGLVDGGAAMHDASATAGTSSPVPSAGASASTAGGSAMKPLLDAGPVSKAGNPDATCSDTLPAQAQPADSSHPTTVVGSGTSATCSFASLSAAIQQGGVITFNCGAADTSIAVSATLNLPTDRNTVIDGGNKITLDGGNSVRILQWNSSDWQKNTHTLTLQHVVLANGKASGTQLIPTRPAPCSQGYNDGQGGALYMRDGGLRAIDVTFTNNQAAELGPDTGGGALYLLGCSPAYIRSCTFSGNQASNAGAMGSLFTTDFIYDSLFDNNSAIGHGANNNDASMCSYMNNGQNEIGSGGNGGAIYSDGVAMDITICGSQIRNNKAGAFGAGIFFTSNDQSNKGTLTIRDTTMFNNIPADSGWEWKPGISTNANTPAPITSNIRR